MPDLDLTLILTAVGIFLARVVDVSIGTVRAIYTIRGHKAISVTLGFVESLVFITAISGVMSGAMNPVKIVFYAGGFATGIFVGLWVEGKIASGWWVLRIITRDDAGELLRRLREAGHAITEVPAVGRDGPVPILLAVVKRRRAKAIMGLVRELAPRALVTVESAGAVINAHAAGQNQKGHVSGAATTIGARGMRPGPVLAGSHAPEFLAPAATGDVAKAA